MVNSSNMKKIEVIANANGIFTPTLKNGDKVPDNGKVGTIETMGIDVGVYTDDQGYVTGMAKKGVTVDAEDVVCYVCDTIPALPPLPSQGPAVA